SAVAGPACAAPRSSRRPRSPPWASTPARAGDHVPDGRSRPPPPPCGYGQPDPARRIQKPACSVLPGDAQNFFQRGIAGQYPAQTILPNAHLGQSRMPHHGVFTGTVVDQTTQGIVDFDQFVDTGPPAIAPTVTLR